MFQSNPSATVSPGASHVLSQRINEDQEILTFPEDEQRLADVEGSSSYGAVASSAVLDSDDQRVDQQDGATTRPGCGMCLYLSVLTSVFLSGLVALSGVVRSTSGSVSLGTDASFPFATTTKHPLRPDKLWGAVELPYPTGAWWLNLAIGEGDYPVAPLPYAIKSTDKGVGVSYSAMRRIVSSKRVQDAYAPDLSVSAAEGVVGHHIAKYDNLTVTIQHDSEGDGYFRTLAARGSPYMTFEFAKATPRIKSNGNILEVDGETAKVGSSMHGTTFKLALSNWETWLVFTSESVTWKLVSEHEVEMKGPFSGIVRVAVLPHPWDEDSEKTLTRHAYAYPRGGRVDFSVNGDEMEMRYEWEKDGFGDLLMMALPHHVDTMVGASGQDAAFVMNDSYQCIKGPMTGIVGAIWTMRDNLTDIAWTAKTTLHEASEGIDDPLLSLSWEQQVRKALADDLHTTLPTAPDVYGFGKQIARMARLALIADELGDDASRDVALATVSAYLTPWMKNANEDLLVYDKTWGGIVTKDGLNDQNADFGNAWYNDHTYHYGYLVYAAAVLTKFHPDFHRTYKKQIEFLVEDIAGRGGSKNFPVARQKDFYDGHSWTSGLFSQSDGKSQESVSESINAYYGVYLLGLAVGDTGMRDWGRVLLAMELRAARKYWQMPDNNGVYDSFFSSHRMVGMVASLEAVQLTWFGDNVEYVHGINMLPFTPITEELLERDFMEQEWPVLETAFDDPDLGPQWASFVSLAGAVVLPVEAWVNITEIDVFDAGNSKTNSLYWVATRPQGAMEAYNETAFKSEVKVEPQCKANSACNARGLTQEKMCCPAADGGWLGCCPSGDGIPEGPSACSSNPQCVALNLKTGLCCPAVSGETLSCCEQESSPESSKAKPVDPQALCSSNEGCLTLDLEGTCCPTEGGTYLGCCGAKHVSSPSAGNSSSPEATGGEVRACSSHPGCASLGGDCCPAPDGTMLECCS